MPAQMMMINIPDEQTIWTLILRNRILIYHSKALGAALSSNSTNLTAILSKNEVYDMIAQGSIDAVKRTGKGRIEVLVYFTEFI
jgi:hypothetical protein